jgi:hypothetical protein
VWTKYETAMRVHFASRTTRFAQRTTPLRIGPNGGPRVSDSPARVCTDTFAWLR